MRPSDPWIERLARLFREHPAWRKAARFIDRRATSNVFFTHRPGEAWHLERRGDETLLLPGAAPDPDFAFRFTPGAIALLEAVRGEAGDFAAALFTLVITEDRATRVDLRIAASFGRLLRRGYVRLLLAAGSRVRAIGVAHGIIAVKDLARLVTRVRRADGDAWEEELRTRPAEVDVARDGRSGNGQGRRTGAARRPQARVMSTRGALASRAAQRRTPRRPGR